MIEAQEQAGAAKVRHSAAAYFTFQGVAVIAWWAALYWFPSARQYFLLERTSETSLLAFWLADISFLGIGSLATAWLCYQNRAYRRIAAWFVAGAVGYAAVYCFTYAFFADIGWLGVILMLPAMIWSGVFAVGLSFETAMFRKAKNSTTSWIVTKTLSQIVVVWTIILVGLPYLITAVESKLGISHLHFPFQKPISAILFVGLSSIGVYAAYIMSKVGRGTPLPLDHAHKLVVSGPYRFVRNPMAVSGVGQGLMVALFLGSPLVAVYALMGSAIWQFIFRPLEEDDLAVRFGGEYEEYRRNVKCWITRATPYQIDGTADSSNSIGSSLGRM
ncbi:MAG: isoprenylcysteine carboxylmethyltransferase family protein [Acidobacteriota bacterium]